MSSPPLDVEGPDSPGLDRSAADTWVDRNNESFEGDVDRTAEELILRIRNAETRQEEQRLKRALFKRTGRFIFSKVQEVASQDELGDEDLKNDLLSVARMGVLKGIEKYDPEKARTVGTSDKKTVLKYLGLWALNHLRPFRDRERHGLSADNVRMQNKIRSVETKLREKHDREPTAAEISQVLWEDRREKVSEERVRKLRDHTNERESLEAPAHDEDESGPTLEQALEGHKPTADEEMAEQERKRSLERMLEQTGSRQSRMRLRLALGLSTENGDGRHERRSPEEIGQLTGHSSDTVRSSLGQIKERLASRRTVRLDRLAAPDFPYSLADLRAMVTDTEACQEVEDMLAAKLSLPTVVSDDGVEFDRGSMTPQAPCPFGEDCDGTLQVTEESFACGTCRTAGNVVDWIAEIHDLERKEALVEAGRRALGLPEEALDPNSERTAALDPGREEKLKQLR